MTEQLPGTAEQLIGQLYSIWFDEYERWARITQPGHLLVKYSIAPNSRATLFVSLEDATQWHASLGTYDRLRFSVRPKDYETRQSFAMKYL